MKVLQLIVLLLNYATCQVCEKDSLVSTKLGSFRGSREHVVGHEIAVFKGVPFAQPPTGSLRFLDPLPITDPWTEVKNVTSYSKVCPGSGNTNYDEDCLYLNVWVPCDSATNVKPVMVFFHGGSFNFGSGSERSGAALAAKGDVLVVSFNNRLGFFGFFYSDLTKDDGSNMGMKDQLLAMKWVHENIANFGGNPEEITLFGHSVGGIAVGMHLLTSASTPYFKRAILESGTPYSFLRPESVEVAMNKSLKLSQFLGCSSQTDTSMTTSALQCLRKSEVRDTLVYGSEKPSHSIILPNPIYGDDFFPQRADVVLRNLDQKNIPLKDVIVGLEKDEGELFVRKLLDIYGDVNFTYESVIDYNSKLYDGKLTSEEQQLLNQHYFKHEDSSETLESKLFRAYGDLYVYCPNYFFTKSYVSQKGQKKKRFMYLLNDKVSKPDVPYCKGVCHGEEQPLVFGKPFLEPEKYMDTDREISEYVMRRWSSFAKGQSLESLGWSEFGQQQEVYNSVHVNTSSEESEKFENCESFWREIFSSRSP